MRQKRMSLHDKSWSLRCCLTLCRFSATHIASQAGFRGFNPKLAELDRGMIQGNRSAQFIRAAQHRAGPGSCLDLMQYHCIETLEDIDAMPKICDSLPEGRATTNGSPDREAIGDRDLVNRTFLFLSCQQSIAGETAPEIGSLCDDALAQAPILCLEQTAFESRPQVTACTCWPRLDTTGLTASPTRETVESISEKFPLDQEYPTTPRTYGGTYPT